MYEQFQTLGVKIIAASFSEPAANQEWITDQEYQYEVWTDKDRTLATTYGAVQSATQQYPSRVTKILDSKGNLILEYNDAGFLRNPQNVLEDCQSIFSQ